MPGARPMAIVEMIAEQVRFAVSIIGQRGHLAFHPAGPDCWQAEGDTARAPSKLAIVRDALGAPGFLDYRGGDDGFFRHAAVPHHVRFGRSV